MLMRIILKILITCFICISFGFFLFIYYTKRVA